MAGRTQLSSLAVASQYEQVFIGMDETSSGVL
jgi:hypothetical protein